jgi:hypothetical protein
MKSLRLGLLAGLLLPLGLATASLAQTDGPPAPSPSPAGDMHHHHRDPAERRAHMADHLRTVLQLTPAQEPALTEFLASMKPPEGAGMDRHDHDMDHGDMDHHDMDQDAHLTTPQRLDKMLAHMDQMHTRMEAHVQAVKTFYAQLSPSQQKAFDDLGPMMMHGGDHHGARADGDEHHHHDGGDHPMGPGGPTQG